MKKFILSTAFLIIASCIIFAQEEESDIYEQLPEDDEYSASYTPPIPQDPEIIISAWSEFLMTLNYESITNIENILNTRPEVTTTLSAAELQALLEAKQQDLLSFISSISKNVHDTLLAIIRNLR